jgi:hypothetical protein
MPRVVVGGRGLDFVWRRCVCLDGDRVACRLFWLFWRPVPVVVMNHGPAAAAAGVVVVVAAGGHRSALCAEVRGLVYQRQQHLRHLFHLRGRAPAALRRALGPPLPRVPGPSPRRVALSAWAHCREVKSRRWIPPPLCPTRDALTRRARAAKRDS